MITIHDVISYQDGSGSLYVDIETTGLSRKNSMIYMIGCLYPEGSHLHLTQWFNDDGQSEKDMLSAFLALVSEQESQIVSFNGNQFDLPFMEYHCQQHGLDVDFSLWDSLDYYQVLRPYQPLFALERGRQKDWERFLGLAREDRFSGGDLIRVYKDCLKKPSAASRKDLLLHNKEDLVGLARLRPLLAYPAVWNGEFTIDELEAGDQGDTLKIRCSCKQPVPVPMVFHDMEPLSAFEIGNSRCSFTLPLVDGELKHYFEDPTQYYYLPAEDRAIHRSVGRYVEKEYRTPANRSNCYIRKKGIFVPLPQAKKLYGFEAGKHMSYDSITLYKKDYKEEETYLEFDEIFGQPPENIVGYLTDLLHEGSIQKRAGG